VHGDVIARAALLSLAFAAACGSGGGFPDAPKPPVPPDPGTFALDWSLVDSSQQPATCAQAGATTVTVALKDEASGDSSAAVFNCALGGAVSGALTPSTYDLNFTLSGSSGVIASAPPQTGIVIQSDLTARVMPIVFTVP
jgi:hypothetical protein